MIISSRKGGDCMDIKERVFLELSLLSYFPYPYIGCSVSEMIEYIRLDNTNFEREEYRRNKEMAEGIDDDCYDTIYLYDVIDDNASSGVVCYVFLYFDYIIFCFRGSEELCVNETDWQDWIDNFAMFLNKPTHQQLYALTILYQFSNDKKFYLCGHSKGGNMAQFCALTMMDTYLENLEGVYSFNSCGMQKGICDTYVHRLKDENFQHKLYIYENEYDCISSVFTHLCSPIVIASSMPCHTINDYYHNHYLYTVVKDHEGLKRVQKKDRLPILLEYLMQLFVKYHSKEWFEKFVAKINEYFNSNLPLQDLCQIIQYQIECAFPKMSNLSLDEILDTSIQDLWKIDNIMILIKMLCGKRNV